MAGLLSYAVAGGVKGAADVYGDIKKDERKGKAAEEAEVRKEGRGMDIWDKQQERLAAIRAIETESSRAYQTSERVAGEETKSATAVLKVETDAEAARKKGIKLSQGQKFSVEDPETGEFIEKASVDPKEPTSGKEGARLIGGVQEKNLGAQIRASVKTGMGYSDQEGWGKDAEAKEKRFNATAAKVEQIIRKADAEGKMVPISYAVEQASGLILDEKAKAKMEENWERMSGSFGKKAGSEKSDYLPFSDEFEDVGGRDAYESSKSAEWLNTQKSRWNDAVAKIKQRPELRARIIKDMKTEGYDTKGL